MRIGGWTRTLFILGLVSVGLAVLLPTTAAGLAVTPFLLAIGIGLLFAGRHYYLRGTRNIPRAHAQSRPLVPRRLVPFVAAHRRELGVLAQIGLAVSLFRLVGLFFGSKWPGFWGAWLLGIGSIALLVICPKWFSSVPKSLGLVLSAWSNTLLVFFSFLVTSYLTHQARLEQYRSIFVTVLLMLLYGRAAVGFARGEIQAFKR